MLKIPGILNHPWLLSHVSIPFSTPDGATYNLLAPPLPPSPSILARPLASAENVDSEIFSSLRIIWGRHADAKGEGILRDLCAPAGQGVHAKAFYFLLGKYREASAMTRSKDSEDESQIANPCSTIDLETLKFNIGWELDHASGLKKYEVSKTHRISSDSRTASSSQISVVQPQPYVSHLSSAPAPRVSSRKRMITEGSLPEKFGSQATSGARAPTTPVQLDLGKSLPPKPASLSASTISSTGRVKASVVGIGRGAPRVFPPRRGNTYSDETTKTESMGTPSLGFSHHLQQLQVRAASASTQRPKSSIGPIRPFNDTEKKSMPSGQGKRVETYPQPHSPIITPTTGLQENDDLNLPLLTAPKMENPQLQRTMDDITQRVNDLVQAVTQAPTSLGENKETGKSTARPRIIEDKENQSIDEESWSHVSVDTERHGFGMGAAANREVGKDLANTAPVTVSPTKTRKEKDKKNRRKHDDEQSHISYSMLFVAPPLDLPSTNPKRSAFGMLGSPIALSSPVHPPPPSSAGRILASPVVGEFKGWFSNLFNWKQSNGHGGLLYSGDDINRTRSNVMLLLCNFGILLSNSSGDSHHPDPDTLSLYCRIEQPLVDQSSGIALKNVRFRVEFRSKPTHSETSSVLSPTIEEDTYFLAAPSPNASQATTPTSANFTRPRASLLLGRTASNSTPVPGFTGQAKLDLPPGCQCIIALVHEKGSMTTFRTVWRRLKEEYGDVGTSYPCFSPAIPTTPYPEHQRMVIG